LINVETFNGVKVKKVFLLRVLCGQKKRATKITKKTQRTLRYTEGNGKHVIL